MHFFAKKSPTPAIFEKKVLATLSQTESKLRKFSVCWKKERVKEDCINFSNLLQKFHSKDVADITIMYTRAWHFTVQRNTIPYSLRLRQKIWEQGK